MDDSNAGRLREEMCKGTLYTCCALVCTLLGVDLDSDTTTSYLLTKEQQAQVRKLLEQIFGDGGIWVSGQFLVPEDFVREEDLFLEEGRVWMTEGLSFSRRAYNEQHFDDKRRNVWNLCVPVVIAFPFDLEIPSRETSADFANIRVFPERCRLAGREELEEIQRILTSVINPSVVSFVNPLLIRPSVIPDFLAKQTEMICRSIARLRTETPR